jgi:hypothetical protein
LKTAINIDKIMFHQPVMIAFNFIYSPSVTLYEQMSMGFREICVLRNAVSVLNLRGGYHVEC